MLNTSENIPFITREMYPFTGLDYWSEFLDKFMCLFVERSLHVLQSTSTWLLWMIVIIAKVVYCSKCIYT